MNIYTRQRGTQEAAGSKSGGGGQSERRAERSGENGMARAGGKRSLVLSSSDVYTVISGIAVVLFATLLAHAPSMSRWKLAQLNVARYF